LIALARGLSSLEEILKQITGERPAILKQRHGEAHYIAGELELKHGNTNAAVENFKLASRDCLPHSLAHILANVRLRHLSEAARSAGSTP
jgi:hypothetical protein